MSTYSFLSSIDPEEDFLIETQVVNNNYLKGGDIYTRPY
jgi:hypothetical protein